MNLTRYEHTTAPQLCALLDGDRYAFAVMRNILKGMFGEVGKIVTDHERLTLCYTCPPYPGWVWMPQDASEGEMERAWALIAQELPPEAGYCVNVSDALAQYIVRAGEGRMRVHMRLNAYGCREAVSPERMAQGGGRRIRRRRGPRRSARRRISICVRCRPTRRRWRNSSGKNGCSCGKRRRTNLRPCARSARMTGWAISAMCIRRPCIAGMAMRLRSCTGLRGFCCGRGSALRCM